MGVVRPPAPIYYEAHVTLEPVFGERLDELTEIAKKHKFRVAELLLKKRADATPERSAEDAFLTGRDVTYSGIYHSMIDVVNDLKRAGFAVWRAKIEAALLDTRSARPDRCPPALMSAIEGGHKHEDE
jgi:hypothetical protein